MIITAEERLMYNVMKAIYESGIPISFKGSMVLKASLIEAGYADDTRHTVDIDANWHSEGWPSGEQMQESIKKALQNSGICLNVRIYRMYAEGRSAGFELSDPSSGEVLFTMDIDVNRPEVQTKIYEIAEIRFRGSSLLSMLADKLSVLSDDKVFRRVKDLIDTLYTFINTFMPRYVVISVGKNNRYGHPDSRTLDMLNNPHGYHPIIHRTDEDGNITVQSNGREIEVSVDHQTVD